MHRAIPPTRFALAAALFAALLARPALAQPTPVAAPKLSMLTVALLYTENKAVHDELKLSEDQVKKLGEDRTKWFKDYTDVPPRERAAKAEELSKANEKALADVLKPEQLKRLRELTLQAVEKQYGGRALRYPEVAAELKLSEDQQTKARTETATAVLSKDQREKWAALKGKELEGDLRPNYAGLRGGSGRGGRFIPPPRTAVLLASPSMQDELKLTDDQRTKVRGFRDQWAKVAPNGPFGTTDEQAKKAEDASKEIEQAAQDMLKPEQQRRLNQIEVQQALVLQPEDAVFTLPQVAAELKLSEGLQKKIAALRDEREKGLVDVYLSAEEADAIAKKAETYRKETYAKLAKLLSEEQQTQLKEVVGKPYKGLLGGGFGGGFGGGGFGGGQVDGGGFGRFGPPAPRQTPLIVLGLVYAEDPALHKELKLTEAQGKKLAELAKKYREESRAIRPPIEDAAKKSDALLRETKKAVGDILSADQLKRFRELEIQQLASRRGSPFGDRVVARYAEVIDGLKLTEGQREKILDGQALDKVLTKDQQEKWAALKGEEFKGALRRPNPGGQGGFPGGGFGGGGFSQPEVVTYLQQPSVQEELKLSDDQKKKVKDLNEKWREATKDIVPAPGGDFQKELEAAFKVMDKAVADLLKPEQERRLREIELQQSEKQGMQSVLGLPQVSEKLSLTESQQKKLKAINDNTEKVQTLIFSERSFRFRGPGPGGEFVSLQGEALTKLSKATDEKLAGVLTDDQKAKLKAMRGEPFKGEIRPNFGPGGQGGGFQGGRPGPAGFAPPA